MFFLFIQCGVLCDLCIKDQVFDLYNICFFFVVVFDDGDGVVVFVCIFQLIVKIFGIVQIYFGVDVCVVQFGDYGLIISYVIFIYDGYYDRVDCFGIYLFFGV